MTYLSAPGDLALHGVRMLGFPTASRVAGRHGLAPGTVEDALLDFEARVRDTVARAHATFVPLNRRWVDARDRDSCHIL